MPFRGVRISCDMVARNCDLASLATLVKRRTLQLKAKFGSRSSYFSFKR
jgi:hypothetical protein